MAPQQDISAIATSLSKQQPTPFQNDHHHSLFFLMTKVSKNQETSCKDEYTQRQGNLNSNWNYIRRRMRNYGAADSEVLLIYRNQYVKPFHHCKKFEFPWLTVKPSNLSLAFGRLECRVCAFHKCEISQGIEIYTEGSHCYTQQHLQTNPVPASS